MKNMIFKQLLINDLTVKTTKLNLNKVKPTTGKGITMVAYVATVLIPHSLFS